MWKVKFSDRPLQLKISNFILKHFKPCLLDVTRQFIPDSAYLMLPKDLFQTMLIWCYEKHCVKSVHIRSYSGPHFPAFGLNTERCGVSLRIQSKCGKIRTTITPNLDTFHAVKIIQKCLLDVMLPEDLFDGMFACYQTVNYKQSLTYLDLPLRSFQKMVT